jgi:hypothetical protein
VRFRRLDSGEDFAISFPTIATTVPTLLVPSQDPGRMYVGAAVYPQGGPGPYLMQFFELQLRDCTCKPLGEVGIPASAAPNQWLQAIPAMREVNGAIVWAALTIDSAGGSGNGALVTSAGSTHTLTGLPVNVGAAGLSADGRSLFATGWVVRAPTSIEIGLEDGAVSSVPSPSPSGWLSPPSANGLRLCIVNTPSAGAGVDVINQSGAVIAHLDLAGMGAGGPLAISDDGRWCASSATETDTDWTGHMFMRSGVLVWDLADIDRAK